MALAWGVRSLRRHPLRTALSLAGIAVASAMLLDMVMLSGGIERSFERLLLGRGFQIRVSPKGTLPFDTEASIAGVTPLVRDLRADPAVAAAGPVLGASLYAARGDSLLPLFGYGIDPAAQGLYALTAGADLAPADTSGVILSRPAAAAFGVAPGDTLRILGGLDPQLAGAAAERRLVVRGLVRWIYDYRGQRSAGLVLPLMQRLSDAVRDDRASFVMLRATSDAAVPALVARLRARHPQIEVNSITELVAQFRQRLLYFRQLSYILGSVSLIVTVLLVATLLTITVNERLGEIATLRAIGVSRASVVRQVLAEGAALTLAGAALGVGLGLATARYLDAILTSFPGLPAAISFFVPEPAALATAGTVLLAAGSLAGLYPSWLAARAPVAATLRAEAT
ncbi:MAG TPA: FtsX-like permease family protein [Gemmatimonadales bacterium]|nr:FtsX-like permease family protein [Gemmatimonadales bacterium]